ncbi:Crp/Fnr family transcriptional regulator [Cetobacterium sp. 8H]|uniref:Crp/Fnr family transcriptional regulator n=1 Tax=Cetobacterium sp. 8H TaxID=2759681 RepID=UPI00163C9080|nr:Crp/Fnr family transcriptional regulator [Cetobacterium sp. 8H]MBC2851077.1 Crp/Fnr family transcriptional regulator [Cetobacterium sp. 8H]
MDELKNLNKFKIFKNIPQNEIEKLLLEINFKIEKLNKNDSFLFRGEELNGMYIVIDGELSAEMLKESGEIQKIENLRHGDIIASAFIFGEKNIIPVDLIALKNTLILHIDKKNLLKLFKLNNLILVNFLDEISNRTQFLSNRIWKNFNKKSIKEKVLDYILENTQGDTVIFKHSIKELSEIFNVSRPSLSRVIGNYVELGILTRIKKNIFKINKKNIDRV